MGVLAIIVPGRQTDHFIIGLSYALLWFWFYTFAERSESNGDPGVREGARAKRRSPFSLSKKRMGA